MTRKELLDEGFEKALAFEGYAVMQEKSCYQYGYADGAEPREKKIKELEKENAELKKRNGELAGQKASLERWFGEAKEIIVELYNIIPASMAEYAKEPMEHAWRFMAEVAEND